MVGSEILPEEQQMQLPEMVRILQIYNPTNLDPQGNNTRTLTANWEPVKDTNQLNNE